MSLRESSGVSFLKSNSSCSRQQSTDTLTGISGTGRRHQSFPLPRSVGRPQPGARGFFWVSQTQRNTAFMASVLKAEEDRAPALQRDTQVTGSSSPAAAQAQGNNKVPEGSVRRACTSPEQRRGAQAKLQSSAGPLGARGAL